MPSIFICTIPLIDTGGFGCVVLGTVFGILLSFLIIALFFHFFSKQKIKRG